MVTLLSCSTSNCNIGKLTSYIFYVKIQMILLLFLNILAFIELFKVERRDGFTMDLKRRFVPIITLILLFLLYSKAIASEKAPYASFLDQLDNSRYQAVVVVKNIKTVDFNPVGYGKSRHVTKYILEINEEFSLKTAQNSITAIFEDDESSMEVGKKYFILSEGYYNYSEIVIRLSCYYFIQNDGVLTMALSENAYRKLANYTLDETREHISSTQKVKILSYVDVDEHLDLILSDCSYIKKGIMIGVYRNDAFTDKLIALSETSKLKTDKPSNYHYTHEIVYVTPQDVKGRFLTEYIVIPTFINEKSYNILLTKGSPGWEEANKLYNNFNADENNKSTNLPLLLRLAGLILIITLALILLLYFIKRRKQEL